MAYAPANESDKQTLPILLSPEKQSQYYIVNNHTWSLRFGLICMTSAIVFVTFWSLYQVIQAFVSIILIYPFVSCIHLYSEKSHKKCFKSATY
ncbi:unnamed protein product [Rotaria socialis]|uniref:Uncharacterized protein n=1 Tax=Rotaria socialis TaxID=392032 RepID=A0A817TRK1_9BILA|nr:unnamed protein product [Rotaria socialis]